MNRRTRRAGAGSLSFAIISTCPEPWGGSEELWYAAARELAARGNRVSVFKKVLEDGHPRVRELREASCHVHDLSGHVPNRLWQLASVFLPARLELNGNRREAVVAGASLAARRPNLVVLAQGQNWDAEYFAWVCRKLRVPYVLIAQKATEMTWPPDWLRPRLRAAYESARLAVFVSEHNLRLTEEEIGVRLDNAVVMRNPVLAGRAGRLPWPTTAGGELRLASIGRLDVREKAQDLLLRVLALEHWRERPVRASIYGEGVDREGLAEMARLVGASNVSFEGVTTDVEAVWRDHHALVLPSRAEGLPLVLVEAMMCGRPAIVTDIGGNAEVVEDGVTGFVAQSATVAALDAALERAWERRDEWPALGAEGARRIRELVTGDPGSLLAERLLEHAGL